MKSYKPPLMGILFLTVCMLLSACTAAVSSSSSSSAAASSSQSSSSQISSVSPPSESASSSQEPLSSSSKEYIEGEPEDIDPGIPVETEHITFYFPEELYEQLTITHTQEPDSLVIAFGGEISGKELELFAVVLGTAGAEDFSLGTLTEGTKTIPVSIRMNVQDPEDWSSAEFEEINLLQERVNDVIIQFYEDPRFTPDQG